MTSLRDHSICENCSEPVYSDGGPKRGWIHTITGNFTCHLGGGDFAAPLIVD
jgi:hypothetical protein